MLDAVGHPSLAALAEAAVPGSIRLDDVLQLPEARSEQEVLGALRRFAGSNRTAVQMIGQGYSDTVTPAVIQRGVLENPAWYTAYTPYQAEISQGRLEALLNFQTMIADLTALPVAGASLLDEATAVGEAVLLMRRAVKGKDSGVVVLDSETLPQTVAVVEAQCRAIGLPLRVEEREIGAIVIYSSCRRNPAFPSSIRSCSACLQGTQQPRSSHHSCTRGRSGSSAPYRDSSIC